MLFGVIGDAVATRRDRARDDLAGSVSISRLARDDRTQERSLNGALKVRGGRLVKLGSGQAYNFAIASDPIDYGSAERCRGGRGRRMVFGAMFILPIRRRLKRAQRRLAFRAESDVYLANVEDFETVNAIYGKYFDRALRARTAVAVKALPRAALLEVDAVALVR